VRVLTCGALFQGLALRGAPMNTCCWTLSQGLLDFPSTTPQKDIREMQAALPTMYTGPNGNLIPARLKLAERITYARGLGMPEPVAQGFGIQDRAASVIGGLMQLLQKADRTDLLEQANSLVNHWNSECDAVFLRNASRPRR
jgi:hypothetical protein